MSETQKIENRFERWWHDEGSGMTPKEGEEQSEYVKRIAEIAWSNAAYLVLVKEIKRN